MAAQAMSDIVERLQDKSLDCHVSEEALYKEAADEIVRLRDLYNKERAARFNAERVSAALQERDKSWTPSTRIL